MPDAAITDAAIADGSMADASTTDAASPDASTPDAGGGPCNPLAPAGLQGCGADKCAWVVPSANLGVAACRTAGVVPLGGACASDAEMVDDCEAGAVCINSTCHAVCSFDGTNTCDRGYNCTAYAGLFANGEDPPPGGACVPGCDPVTQLRADGNPCGASQGCYLLSSTTTTIAVCAGAGSLGHGQLITGTTYANSCLPGHQPRRRDLTSMATECGALCQVAPVTSTLNQSLEGGVSPSTCVARGAAPPDDTTNGESCRYWWARESADGVTPYSNTVGWCFRHAAFEYDSNGDMLVDAPYPRCTTLTTGDVVLPLGTPPHSDAQYFWCAPKDPPPPPKPRALRPTPPPRPQALLVDTLTGWLRSR